MAASCEFVVLFFTLSGAHAWIAPSNIIDSKDILNIPHIIANISGFGSKGKRDTGDGIITVMGRNYESMVPSFAQNILGMNKTRDNSTNSGSSSNGGGNFGFISGIPNRFSNMTGIGGNNNGIPGYGIISSIPNHVFVNNTSSNNSTSNGFPYFSSIIPGILGNKNKSNSINKNGTNNLYSTESGSTSNNGFPDFGSYIPGLSNRKNRTCGSSNRTQTNGKVPTYFGYIPAFPSNIFSTNSSDSKNDTSSNNSNILKGIHVGSISNIPDKILGNNKENKTRQKRHCSGRHGNHGEEHEHDETESRKKRQIGSGLGSLGSLVPGASNLGSLGSALGTSNAGDATLVLGMFQVLVKPIKTPSINGVTDIINNPQSILTQPQNLLNGGKR